jgi:hypothetical protein
MVSFHPRQFFTIEFRLQGTEYLIEGLARPLAEEKRTQRRF